MSDFVVTRPDRTIGGSLLRSAIDAEVAKLAIKPGRKSGGAVFSAYDQDTGVRLGVAVMAKGPLGTTWIIEGGLSRKVQASQIAMHVELKAEARW